MLPKLYQLRLSLSLLQVISPKETMPEEGRIAEDRVTPTIKDLKQMASQMARMTRSAQTTTNHVLRRPVLMITTLQKEQKEPSARRSLRLASLATLTAAINSQRLQDRQLPPNQHRHPNRLK